MKCPVCDAELTEEQPSDDYTSYVADDDGTCIAYADGIKTYDCPNRHRIYIGQD